MNRPKKNKAINPTLPEDQQVDERHLVDVEESEDISIEDRIHLYWTENKGFISGAIILLAVLIIGFNGMRLYQQHAEANLQEAYTEALAADDLAGFAKAHPGNALGGIAALEVADKFYAAEDYASAMEYYEIAVEALTHDLLDGRAQLGLAFTIFKNGDAAKGLALLEALADDPAVPQPIRQEAAYHLAIEADVEGDSKRYEQYASQVTDSGAGGPWQQRLQFYQQRR
ncbi:MAG: tetratricopeptide repeat protein [Opitutales bacterium]